MLIITAACIILIVITAFLLRIEAGILMFFACSTSIQYLEKTSLGPLSGLDYFGIALPALFITGLIINNKKVLQIIQAQYLIKHFFITLILLLFCGVIFTGIIYSAHTYNTFIDRLGVWCKLFNNFIILVTISLLFFEHKNINKLLNCMVLSLLFPSLIFAFQLITGATVFNPRTGYSFASAFFHHPGVIAYAFIFHFPISIFKYFNARSSIERIFWLLITLLFLCFIYFTYRRGVWLALLVQLCIYCFFLQKLKYRFLSSYFATLLIIILAFTQISSTFIDRFSDFAIFFTNLPDAINTHMYDELFSGRWGFYRANLFYLLDQPITNLLFGNGIGATHFVSDKLGVDGGGHNIYLILLIDYGLIAFLAYISFMFSIVFKLFRSLNTSDPYVSAFSKMLITLFISYFVMGMVTHVLYTNAPNWLLYGLLGAFLGLDYNADKKYLNVYS